MRRTKIVATIGPASREPETLVRLVQAGMDVARLNYSHGTLEEHAETVNRVRDAAGRVGRPVAILQSPADIEHVREHTRLPLIAKMEKPQAVERATEILKAADCVMVARGDLGIELPIARVPIVQKQLLELAGWMARPSITATQM